VAPTSLTTAPRLLVQVGPFDQSPPSAAQVPAVVTQKQGWGWRRLHGGQRVGDREGVAVEEHQQVVGVGLVEHDTGQVIELAGVAAGRGHHDVEPVVPGGVDALQRGVGAVGLRQVAAQVADLYVDPAGRPVVDGDDVDHGRAGGRR